MLGKKIFEENLKLICHIDYKSGSDLWVQKVRCLDIIIKLKEKVSDINCVVKEINPVHGKMLIDKSLKNLFNLKTILENFEEKIKKIPQTIKFVCSEVEKLNQDDKKIEIKASILADKIRFTYAQLYMISEILKLMDNDIGKIELKNNRLEMPLDKLCNIIKRCLKETEAYNISKLKHAQEKFYLSKELGDFMYGKKNPKLAHLLGKNFNDDKDLPPYEEGSDEEKKQDIDKTARYELKTPFGSVWVGSGKYGNGRVISLKKNKEDAPNYDEMCKELDFNFNPDLYTADLHKRKLYKN